MKLSTIAATSLGVAFMVSCSWGMAAEASASTIVTKSTSTVSSEASQANTNEAPQNSAPANSGTNNAANSTTELQTEKDKLSYTIGVDMGENFKQQAIDIDPEILARGLADVFANKPLLMNKAAMEQTLQEFQKKLHANREAIMKQLASKNKKKGEEFLATNKDKKGIQQTASGMQYRIIKEGKGAMPTLSDTVTVEYTGKLLNGSVFDSTEKTGKPVTFRVSDVIAGWTEALQKMKTGSIWEVYLPPQLAYGEQGIGGLIGPNETLIFRIRLIAVDQPAHAKPGDAQKLGANDAAATSNTNAASTNAKSAASNGADKKSNDAGSKPATKTDAAKN
ncbi:MAG: hypothetical protein Tsb005_08260 [Gammaproteobacteria bacterium]